MHIIFSMKDVNIYYLSHLLLGELRFTPSFPFMKGTEAT